MTPASPARSLLAEAFSLLAVLLVTTACGSKRLAAPAPPRELTEVTESLPPPPRGVIVAPLEIDWANAMAALNRLIPTTIGDLNQTRLVRIGRDRQASMAFEVKREPFEVLAVSGDTIDLAAILHYRGKAWLGSALGSIGGSCGIDKVPPRARVVLRVVPYLTRDWQFGVTSQVAQLTALSDTERDRCKATFLGLNVTGKVMEAAKEVLEKLLPKIQERFAAFDVKGPLTDIWADLQKPIRLADSIYLVLQPDSIQVGPLHGTRKSVHAELGITAAPRVLTGPRPRVDTVPLPPYNRVKMDRGFSLPIEGSLDYEVMSAQLTRQFRTKTLKAAGGEFRLHSATLYGIAGGKIAVGVDFEGTEKGLIWLTGTPQYDSETGMITVPDLDFDASSAGLLIAGYAWIKGDDIRNFLRQQAKISAGALLSRLQHMAVKEMNRTLTRGVRLHATIGAAEPSALVVRPRDILVRARAVGTAKLEIGPELFEKKQKVADKEPGIGTRDSGLGKSPTP
jgi:hypothetical protein